MSFHEENGDISQALSIICGKGVRIWMENGRLRYKAPRGVLTQYELEVLKSYKSNILEYLSKQAQDSLIHGDSYDRHINSFPLTYSQ